MDLVVRPDGRTSMNALRLLAAALSNSTLPEGWTYAVSPLGIVLTAPDPEFAEGGVRFRHYERNKLATAESLVVAACRGRAGLMPYYFQVDRPLSLAHQVPRANTAQTASGGP